MCYSLSRMAEARRKWLILVHQLPPHPSNLRVRIWRRLQQVGAVVLRNSLYVLPASEETREDFNWVREEIAASGGQVSVLEASAVDGYTENELVQQFRKLRTADYEGLAAEIRGTLANGGTRTRRRTPADRERTLRALRERFKAIQSRDYFGAAGRALVEQAFRDLERAESTPAAGARTTKLRAADYWGRTWVTRVRPGIDRIACAWLIRRFIAPDARFAFITPDRSVQSLEVPFDLADVEFGHHASHCTFETLMLRFGINDAGVVSLSRVVHDLDLKETRYGMPECAAVGRMIDGLRATYANDAELLEHGIVFMESLYRSFAAETKGPRTRR